jgi:hypothetical protein
MITASSSPGQGGMAMTTQTSGALPLQRYWKDVPRGMSMHTPGMSLVTLSWPSGDRRQISPSPDRTNQYSWMVRKVQAPDHPGGHRRVDQVAVRSVQQEADVRSEGRAAALRGLDGHRLHHDPPREDGVAGFAGEA